MHVGIDESVCDGPSEGYGHDSIGARFYVYDFREMSIFNHYCYSCFCFVGVVFVVATEENCVLASAFNCALVNPCFLQ